IVYGVPSGSAKKRKPPELDTTSVANKIIKTEDPILIEEDMTTATDQAYMGGNNSAMAEQGAWASNYGNHDSTVADISTVGPSQKSPYGYPEPVEVEDTYTCELCVTQFPTIRCVEYHKQLVHNKFCDVCNTRLDQESDAAILEHGLTHKHTKSHQCSHCFKLFNSAAGLKVHLGNDLRCLMCGHQFLRSGKTSHMRQCKKQHPI
ncbi:unnamed protein product, partial [Owenia fusiformis]